jgi:hypothetical protein
MQHAFMIDIEDKPGALADIAEAIAAKGVNISSISGATCGDKSRVAIATEDNAQTRAALADLNCTFEQKEITTAALPHQPGSLAKAARQLANQGVNIESILLLGMQGQDIEVGFVTSDPVMAKNALSHVGSASA